MLVVVEDTTEGVHDTMIAACDKERYEELGGGSEHRNCADNLVEGLGALGESFQCFSKKNRLRKLSEEDLHNHILIS